MGLSGEAKRGGKNILDGGDMRKFFQKHLHQVCRRAGWVASVPPGKSGDWGLEGRKD